MSEQLRPCPFCTNPHKAEYRKRGMWHFVVCGCCGSRTGNWFSKEQAIEAWNTRAERTCKFVANVMNTAFDDDDNEIETGEVDEESDMSCGNCGYPMMRGEYDGWWDEEQGPHGGYFLKPRFNCCPECGHEVVDWDGRKKED